MQEFQIPVIFEYVATFTWAMSGAILGIRKGYDITGVFIVAIVSCTGGSILRDGVFLQRIPPVLTNWVFLPLILSAVLFVIFFGRYLLSQPRNRAATDNLVLVIDAVGSPAFAVIGMQLALAAGIPIPGVMFIGVVNGVGGGLLRDVVVNDTPSLLLPGHYFAVTLGVATAIYLLLTLGAGLDAQWVGWAMVGAFLITRLIVLRFNLRTTPLKKLTF